MSKTGVSAPLRANKAGSFVNSMDSIHVSELLSVALNSGDSDNPFQQPGLGESAIFQLADETTFARVANRIKDIFEDFEENELATLQDKQGNLTAFQDPDDPQGQYGIRVYFLDLQRDKQGSLSVFAGRTGLVVRST